MPRVHHATEQGWLDLPLPPGIAKDTSATVADAAVRQDGFVASPSEGAWPWARGALLRRPYLDGAANNDDDMQEIAWRRLGPWSSRELDEYIHILLTHGNEPPPQDGVDFIVAHVILLDRQRERERQWRQALLARMRSGPTWQTEY